MYINIYGLNLLKLLQNATFDLLINFEDLAMDIYGLNLLKLRQNATFDLLSNFEDLAILAILHYGSHKTITSKSIPTNSKTFACR